MRRRPASLKGRRRRLFLFPLVIRIKKTKGRKYVRVEYKEAVCRQE